MYRLRQLERYKGGMVIFEIIGLKTISWIIARIMDLFRRCKSSMVIAKIIGLLTISWIMARIMVVAYQLQIAKIIRLKTISWIVERIIVMPDIIGLEIIPWIMARIMVMVEIIRFGLISQIVVKNHRPLELVRNFWLDYGDGLNHRIRDNLLEYGKNLESLELVGNLFDKVSYDWGGIN